jgi:hypothetical protein
MRDTAMSKPTVIRSRRRLLGQDPATGDPIEGADVWLEEIKPGGGRGNRTQYRAVVPDGFLEERLSEKGSRYFTVSRRQTVKPGAVNGKTEELKGKAASLEAPALRHISEEDVVSMKEDGARARDLEDLTPRPPELAEIKYEPRDNLKGMWPAMWRMASESGGAVRIRIGTDKLPADLLDPDLLLDVFTASNGSRRVVIWRDRVLGLDGQAAAYVKRWNVELAIVAHDVFRGASRLPSEFIAARAYPSPAVEWTEKK